MKNIQFIKDTPYFTSIIQKLLKLGKFKAKRVLVINDPYLTKCGFMGCYIAGTETKVGSFILVNANAINPTNRTSLNREWLEEELCFILGHELGHYKYHKETTHTDGVDFNLEKKCDKYGAYLVSKVNITEVNFIKYHADMLKNQKQIKVETHIKLCQYLTEKDIIRKLEVFLIKATSALDWDDIPIFVGENLVVM